MKIWNPAQPVNKEELEVVVDTGASYSWIRRSRLEPLGIQSVRRMKFRTIEGRTIERDLAPVFLSVDGYTGGDNVVLAETGDAEVLGAHSLESLGLSVNSVEKKLEPSVGLALTARVRKRRSRVPQASGLKG
ncbi:MAG: aspartyl protease family protein, partial [Nevskiales bacterium]